MDNKMTDKNKHTKTPWYLKTEVYDANPTIDTSCLKIMGANHKQVAHIKQLDGVGINNGKIIIKAVNNHEKLVTALEDLESFARSHGNAYMELNDKELGDMYYRELQYRVEKATALIKEIEAANEQR